MALANLHICTGLTELSLCQTAISTKIKCAGSFDLFFTLNQVKLNMKVAICDIVSLIVINLVVVINS